MEFPLPVVIKYRIEPMSLFRQGRCLPEPTEKAVLPEGRSELYAVSLAVRRRMQAARARRILYIIITEGTGEERLATPLP